jgi:hypothetical protein
MHEKNAKLSWRHCHGSSNEPIGMKLVLRLAGFCQKLLVPALSAGVSQRVGRRILNCSPAGEKACPESSEPQRAKDLASMSPYTDMSKEHLCL